MSAVLGLLDLVPRWVLAVLLAIATTTATVERFNVAEAQLETAQARRDVATLTASIEKAKADAEQQRAGWEAKLSEAEQNARNRENDLRAAAGAARAESDGLRDDVADLRRSLEGATAAAATERAIAIGSVLDQCASRYSGLAARCDRHVNDLRTMIEAWPH